MVYRGVVVFLKFRKVFCVVNVIIIGGVLYVLSFRNCFVGIFIGEFW